MFLRWRKGCRPESCLVDWSADSFPLFTCSATLLFWPYHFFSNQWLLTHPVTCVLDWLKSSFILHWKIPWTMPLSCIKCFSDHSAPRNPAFLLSFSSCLSFWPYFQYIPCRFFSLCLGFCHPLCWKCLLISIHLASFNSTFKTQFNHHFLQEAFLDFSQWEKWAKYLPFFFWHATFYIKLSQDLEP